MTPPGKGRQLWVGCRSVAGRSTFQVQKKTPIGIKHHLGGRIYFHQPLALFESIQYANQRVRIDRFRPRCYWQISSGLEGGT